MPQTLSAPTDPTCLAQPRLGRIALLVGLALSLGVVLRVQAATTWTVCASGCTYIRASRRPLPLRPPWMAIRWRLRPESIPNPALASRRA
jgi:hypothetical protein